MIIAFTGHRKLHYKQYNYIFFEIEKQLQQLKPEKIISGMAIGADTIAVQVAIKNNIPFIAAIPFVGQEKNVANLC